MSTLKTVNVQVGQSATANQNFTLYQPSVPDGTVRLGVGNSGATTADAVTVTNAGNATVLGNLTVSGAGTSTFAGTLNATTALQSGGIAAERVVRETPKVTTSGTAVGFTGLPSWVDRITVQIMGVSTTAGGAYIQIGSGSYVSTGYLSGYGSIQTSSSATASATGFLAVQTQACYGSVILTLANSTTNTWVASGSIWYPAAPAMYVITGQVSLSGVLDRIQITTTGAFNAGSVNIIYEG